MDFVAHTTVSKNFFKGVHVLKKSTKLGSPKNVSYIQIYREKSNPDIF